MSDSVEQESPEQNLPSSELESFYLTTPIYFVNSVPHLGTAYTTIAADSLARFKRLDGKDTLFLTGLDEHGQKITQSAAAEGLTPQEWVDNIAPKFIDTWKSLGISYDGFIRTTEPRHIQAVQRFFQKLYDNGAIYKGAYKGYYCVPEETFFNDDELFEFAEKRAAEGLAATNEAGQPLCPDCGRPLTFVEEENLYFRLSDYQQRLLDYYEENPNFIRPEIRRNEVVAFVKGGLKDLSVSRTTFDWGVPIPFAEGHVSYVWVDALINYLTAVGYGSDSASDAEEFARRWPAQIHFVGKDIIRFHCVIWPAMLMAAGIELPRQVFAHGFLLTKGEKMSKSLGNVMSPLELAETFSVDGYRYYFLSDFQFGADGSLTMERIIQVYNADLANSWGNLCSRALNMTKKYLDSEVVELWPRTDAALTKRLGNPLREKAETLYASYSKAMDDIDFSKAMAKVLELVDAANLYIEQTAPWSLAKEAAAETAEAEAAGINLDDAKAPTKNDVLDFVLYNLLESIRIAALLFAPVMPQTSAEVWRRLGLGDPLECRDLSAALEWGGLPSGNRVEVGDPLFPRLDADLA
ncbi:MAG: methionine--tRNA ligase [Coriobacteriales bacterium]|jgi:methionyl-tRNA synthetase|nr:methionine--tRNA ligase [Coriobacteriales bacterium]